MIKSLDTYDWAEAFGYCGEPGTNGSADIRQANPAESVPLDPFTREDVQEIHYAIEGENDGPPWRMVGKLKDGRWFYLEAGCDYTGWDCRGGGSACMAKSLSQCIRFGCTQEARDLFGITDGDESNPTDHQAPASGAHVQRVVGCEPSNGETK